jgi:hypothetical protein
MMNYVWLGMKKEETDIYRVYDELYERLGTKKGEKDIYRMAKSRERKMTHIIQVKCIKMRQSDS